MKFTLNYIPGNSLADQYITQIYPNITSINPDYPGKVSQFHKAFCGYPTDITGDQFFAYISIDDVPVSIMTIKWIPSHDGNDARYVIYNVCVDNTKRGKRLATNMIREFQEKVFSLDVLGREPLKTVDLGVDIRDKDMLPVRIGLYSKLGFKPMGVGNSFEGFDREESFPFVIFRANRYYNTLKDERYYSRNIKIANNMAETYGNDAQHLDFFRISAEHASYIKRIYETTDIAEIGGRLKYSLDDPEHELIVDVGAIMNGPVVMKGNIGSTNVPEGSFTFHSHPPASYHLTGSILGWPSGQDFKSIIYNYIRTSQFVHFVLAKEGVYDMRITIEAQILLRKLMNHIFEFNGDTNFSFIQYSSLAIATIMEAVKSLFTLMHDARTRENINLESVLETMNKSITEITGISRKCCNPSDTDIMVNTINEILKTQVPDNELEYKEIVHQLLKVPLISVSLMSWDTLLLEGHEIELRYIEICDVGSGYLKHHPDRKSQDEEEQIKKISGILID